MSALSIQPTFPIFTETDGLPLENGYIWIGAANLDPQGNPINVYWDSALTIAAPQPIRTINGYPSRNGTPGRLYVNSDYSIRVQNSKGSLVYSAPAATERYSGVVLNINAQDVVYDPPFTGAVQTNVEAKLSQTISVADFGASPSATASANTIAIQAAINSIPETEGGTIIFPQGTYNVNGNIDSNNRQGLVIDGCGATINLTTSTSYLFTITDVGVEVRNLFVTKGNGVVASAFYVSGIRHVFNNVQSGEAKWTRFFHLVDCKESFFTNLNIYLDSATKAGTVFYLDYSVNNTFSDSFIGFCEHGVFASGTAQPTLGYKSEGWLMSNVIIVYPQKAMTIDAGTLFSVVNCCFDFCEIWGIYQSNGNNLKVMNTWIASNTTNGFIGVGTTNVVFGVSVIGNVFVRGAAAITGTGGVGLTGPNALVVGNAFQSGMNGGVVTDPGSQVIGNSVSVPGTNIVANTTVSTIIGSLSVETNLEVAGAKGIFPQGVSGSATTGANGAPPAQVKGYVTVRFDDGSGLANYKIPYYNV